MIKFDAHFCFVVLKKSDSVDSSRIASQQKKNNCIQSVGTIDIIKLRIRTACSTSVQEHSKAHNLQDRLFLFVPVTRSSAGINNGGIVESVTTRRH